MIKLKTYKGNFHIFKIFMTTSRQKLGTILEKKCALKNIEVLKKFNNRKLENHFQKY